MKKIIFNKEDHTYKYDKYTFISVTQLLSKHGIGKDYSKVSDLVLYKAKERGSQIHEEVQDFITNGIYPINFEESASICKALEPIKKKYTLESEVITYTPLDYKVLIAGTIDIKEIKNKNTISLYDIKTYKHFTLESLNYATWQLSLYSYLERLRDKNLKVDNLYVIYIYDKKAIFKKVKPISDEEINNLIDCEDMGLIYQEKLNSLPVTLLDNKSISLFKEIKRLQEEIDNLKAREELIKQGLYNYMQKENIQKAVSFDKLLTITKIDEQTSQKIDSKLLKEEMPEVYEKYKRDYKKNGYVKLTLNY